MYTYLYYNFYVSICVTHLVSCCNCYTKGEIKHFKKDSTSKCMLSVQYLSDENSKAKFCYQIHIFIDKN